MSEALMDPALAAACQDGATTAAWAREFLEFLPKEGWSDAEANAVYADWFKAQRGTAHLSRRGCCLGYLAVRSAALAVPIRELTSWGPDRFFALVEAKLRALKKDALAAAHP